MPNAGQEYVLCFNSANRDQVVYPEPNNFECQISDGGQGTAIPKATAMFFGSVELPRTQWTIEQEWSQLLFDQGIATDVAIAADLPNATFSFVVMPPGTSSTLVDVPVPPTINPITAGAPNGANEATFTTQFPHGLEARQDWGSIRIEGTPLMDDAAAELTTNPTLTIVSPTMFTITNIPGIAATIGNGYLRAAPPNPAQLAAAITDALPAALADAGLVGVAAMAYDANTNVFTFTYDDGSADTIVMLATTIPSLNSHMGFGNDTMLVLTPTAGSATQMSLSGNYANSGCLGTLQLTPGNYTPTTLAAEIERAWDPFVFDGGVAMDPAEREVFAFTNASAASFTVPIDYGAYTPDTFAAYLTTQMNAADGSQTYTVTYDGATQQMTLASTMPFGLPFNDPTVTPAVVTRLGFDPVAYNGSTGYTGRSLAYAPSTCTLTPRTRGGNLQVIQNVATNMYTLQFLGAPCQAGTIAGTTVGPLAMAHGLQVGDFVVITDAGGTAFTLPVTAVTDAFTFDVDLYNSGLAGAVTVCPAVATDGVLNLYLNGNQMLADVLGFTATGVFSGPNGVLAATGSYNLDGPPYLLWIITEPSGSTFIHHFWKGKLDNKTNIFAKLIQRDNTYSIERLFPMQQVMQQNPKVTRLIMSVCNPDHSPYHFHGRNWSGTLTFLTSSESGQQLSY